ncbi:hypothetical protein JTE90_014548 [Oedothorax gibbosus]|uniref:Uncharacterized protein n=1 Tax=Oedothorax gibbosus TaxID=931172 RepID=A0AAV6UEE9_9ARAC|nr:hypothetical protein JTE90_014548 [Oedothorax gibbosus]
MGGNKKDKHHHKEGDRVIRKEDTEDTSDDESRKTSHHKRKTHRESGSVKKHGEKEKHGKGKHGDKGKDHGKGKKGDVDDKKKKHQHTKEGDKKDDGKVKQRHSKGGNKKDKHHHKEGDRVIRKEDTEDTSDDESRKTSHHKRKTHRESGSVKKHGEKEKHGKGKHGDKGKGHGRGKKGDNDDKKKKHQHTKEGDKKGEGKVKQRHSKGGNKKDKHHHKEGDRVIRKEDTEDTSDDESRKTSHHKRKTHRESGSVKKHGEKEKHGKGKHGDKGKDHGKGKKGDDDDKKKKHQHTKRTDKKGDSKVKHRHSKGGNKKDKHHHKEGDKVIQKEDTEDTSDDESRKTRHHKRKTHRESGVKKHGKHRYGKHGDQGKIHGKGKKGKDDDDDKKKHHHARGDKRGDRKAKRQGGTAVRKDFEGTSDVESRRINHRERKTHLESRRKYLDKSSEEDSDEGIERNRHARHRSVKKNGSVGKHEGKKNKVRKHNEQKNKRIHKIVKGKGKHGNVRDDKKSHQHHILRHGEKIHRNRRHKGENDISESSEQSSDDDSSETNQSRTSHKRHRSVHKSGHDVKHGEKRHRTNKNIGYIRKHGKNIHNSGDKHGKNKHNHKSIHSRKHKRVGQHDSDSSSSEESNEFLPQVHGGRHTNEENSDSLSDDSDVNNSDKNLNDKKRHIIHRRRIRKNKNIDYSQSDESDESDENNSSKNIKNKKHHIIHRRNRKNKEIDDSQRDETDESDENSYGKSIKKKKHYTIHRRNRKNKEIDDSQRDKKSSGKKYKIIKRLKKRGSQPNKNVNKNKKYKIVRRRKSRSTDNSSSEEHPQGKKGGHWTHITKGKTQNPKDNRSKKTQKSGHKLHKGIFKKLHKKDDKDSDSSISQNSDSSESDSKHKEIHRHHITRRNRKSGRNELDSSKNIVKGNRKHKKQTGKRNHDKDTLKKNSRTSRRRDVIKHPRNGRTVFDDSFGHSSEETYDSNERDLKARRRHSYHVRKRYERGSDDSTDDSDEERKNNKPCSKDKVKNRSDGEVLIDKPTGLKPKGNRPKGHGKDPTKGKRPRGGKSEDKSNSDIDENSPFGDIIGKHPKRKPGRATPDDSDAESPFGGIIGKPPKRKPGRGKPDDSNAESPFGGIIGKHPKRKPGRGKPDDIDAENPFGGIVGKHPKRKPGRGKPDDIDAESPFGGIIGKHPKRKPGRGKPDDIDAENPFGGIIGKHPKRKPGRGKPDDSDAESPFGGIIGKHPKRKPGRGKPDDSDAGSPFSGIIGRPTDKRPKKDRDSGIHKGKGGKHGQKITKKNEYYTKIYYFLINLSFEEVQKVENRETFYRYFQLYPDSPEVFSFFKNCYKHPQKPSNFDTSFQKVWSIITNSNKVEITDELYEIFEEELFVSTEENYGDNYKLRWEFLKDLTFGDLQDYEISEQFYFLFQFHIKSESQFKLIKFCHQWTQKPANYELNFQLVIDFIFSGTLEISNEIYIDFCSNLFVKNAYKTRYEEIYEFLKDLSYEKLKTKFELRIKFYSYFQFHVESESFFKFIQFCFQYSHKPANFDENFEICIKEILSIGDNEVSDKYYSKFLLDLFESKENENYGTNYLTIYNFLRFLTFEDCQSSENRLKFFNFFRFYPDSPEAYDFIKLCFSFSVKPLNFETHFQVFLDELIGGSFELSIDFYLKFLFNLFGEGGVQYCRRNYKLAREFLINLKTYDEVLETRNWLTFFFFFGFHAENEDVFEFVQSCHEYPEMPRNFELNFRACVDFILDSGNYQVTEELYIKFRTGLFGNDANRNGGDSGSVDYISNYQEVFLFLSSLSYEEVLASPEDWELFYKYFHFHPKTKDEWDFVKFCYQSPEMPRNFGISFQTVIDQLSSSSFQFSEDFSSSFLLNLFEEGSFFHYGSIYEQAFYFFLDLTWDQVQADPYYREQFKLLIGVYPETESFFLFIKACFKYEQVPANFEANFQACLSDILTSGTYEVSGDLYIKFTNNLWGDQPSDGRVQQQFGEWGDQHSNGQNQQQFGEFGDLQSDGLTQQQFDEFGDLQSDGLTQEQFSEFGELQSDGLTQQQFGELGDLHSDGLTQQQFGEFGDLQSDGLTQEQFGEFGDLQSDGLTEQQFGEFGDLQSDGLTQEQFSEFGELQSDGLTQQQFGEFGDVQSDGLTQQQFGEFGDLQSDGLTQQQFGDLGDLNGQQNSGFDALLGEEQQGGDQQFSFSQDQGTIDGNGQDTKADFLNQDGGMTDQHLAEDIPIDIPVF